MSNKKLTVEEMRKIAEAKGGKCLSNVYVNANTKYEWECVKGHVWQTTYNNVQKGRWCPACASNKKLTIEDMQKLAEAKGGKCLSKKYVNNKTKLEWECSEGHMWQARNDNVKRGSWCPFCYSRRIKSFANHMVKLTDNKIDHKTPVRIINLSRNKNEGKTIDDMQELAESRGGKCLSEVYVNSKTKLKWQCSKGHVWSAVPSSIQRGTWCPCCANKK